MKTTIKAAFKVFNTNAKGEVSIGLVLKGDLKDAQILALHKLKATGVVFADLFDGQTDIDDYEHDDVSDAEPQRITYQVNNGEVNVNADQLSMEDIVGDGVKVVDAIDFNKEGQPVGEDIERQLNWLEQEELVAEQEVKEIEQAQLSDELE